MKQFLKAIYRQLTGSSSPRESKVEIGYWAYKQMRELHLDTDTLEDVFKNGRKVTTIVQDYQNFTISIGYKWDERHTCYVITSVRLYKRQVWKKR